MTDHEWKEATKRPVLVEYRGPYENTDVIETIEGDFEVDELTPPSNERAGELEPGETQPSELVPTESQPTELPLEPPDITGEIGIDAEQALIGQREQERPAPDEPTIGPDDIVEDVGEPDQPPPSTRERQRRDDLFTPGREFPTGESAVVGRGTDTVDDVQERRDTAETPSLFEGTRFGPDTRSGVFATGRGDLDLLSGDRPDVGDRGDTVTTTAQQLGLRTDQRVRTEQVFETVAPATSGEGLDTVFDVDVQEREQVTTATGGASTRGAGRLRLFDQDDNRADEVSLFEVSDDDFGSGIADVEEILGGER